MDSDSARYTIRVEGHLGDIALTAFAGLTAEHQQAQTVMHGHLNQSSLHEVFARLEALGLVLVEVHRITATDVDAGT